MSNRLVRRIPSSFLLPFLLCCLAAAARTAPPPELLVSGPESEDPEEVCIAIDPTNPSRLVAGANINHVFRSGDGGLTWTTTHLASPYGVWGDPCVLFTPDGTALYAHLSNPPFGSWLDRLVVHRSADGGATWDDGVGVGLNPPRDQDKEWLAVDATDSPWRGNLYMAWTEFDAYGSPASGDSTRILFARSTDGGATWSDPACISDRGGDCQDGDETVEGAVPAVGPGGEVYVAWAGPEGIVCDRSLDGGVSWGADVFVTDQPGGWAFDVPGVWRCNGLPQTACDTSDSPYRGRVYVLFSDQRHGTDDTDVFLCHSDDRGQTWSPPVKVNTDPGPAHQFYPWLAVDPVDGNLYVVFYDRRRTTGDATEVWVAASADGGETFTDFPVSDTPFTPTGDVFFGDYIGIAARGGAVHPVWTRMDEGELSVWTAVLSFPTGVAPGERPAVRPVELFRQPVATGGASARLVLRLPVEATVRLTIHDLRGRLVRTLLAGRRGPGEYRLTWDGTDEQGAAVASGVYLCRVVAGETAVSRKITIVR